MSRTTLTFQWKTGIFIWFANYPNAVILLISAWNNKLAHCVAGGKIPLVGVFCFDWDLDKIAARGLKCTVRYSNNTCVHVIWLRSTADLHRCAERLPRTWLKINHQKKWQQTEERQSPCSECKCWALVLELEWRSSMLSWIINWGNWMHQGSHLTLIWNQQFKPSPRSFFK